MSRLQRVLKNFLLLGIFLSLIIWIIHLSFVPPSEATVILLYPELYFFIGGLVGYYFLYMQGWKAKVYQYENDIYETIAYRKKTSLRNISEIKHIKERLVKEIIERLIAQEKLFGSIKDGLFISERTMRPICAVCNKEIEDLHLNMVLCPHCKRSFHKDHLIDYINEMEEKCPNCKKSLTLADIIK
ncbi:MAG: hypothetical protein EU544_06540 [Promethearchaeota archaeon]|nr:MAG: hypothetical protein EU544_06540 [Candidatus Lokiarchaeota archaeon]